MAHISTSPAFVTQHRQLRDFLADQDRLAAIKSDWLYRLVDVPTRARILRSHGFTPVIGRDLPQRRSQPARVAVAA